MDNLFLSLVVEELRPVVTGKQIAGASMTGVDIVIDLRLPDNKVLIVKIDPAFPALFLADRESQSAHLSPFGLLLRKRLTGARLLGIAKDGRDRIVLFDLEKFEASGDRIRFGLFVSLKGRSSNIYLADANGVVEQMWAERGDIGVGDRIGIDEQPVTSGELLCDLGESATEQEIIEKRFGPHSPLGTLLRKEFQFRCRTSKPIEAFRSLLADAMENAPKALIYSVSPPDEVGSSKIDLRSELALSHFPLRSAEHLKRYEFETLSEAASQYEQARARAQVFQSQLSSLTRLLRTEIKKRDSLLEEFGRQKSKHQNPEGLKRSGDLLLANIATARADGSKVRVIDYFDEGQPEIEIEIGEGKSIQQAAADYFSRYQKAKRALSAIESQRQPVEEARDILSTLLDQLEQRPTLLGIEETTAKVERTFGKKVIASAAKKKASEPGAGRSFQSSDGYEIVVGRNDRENDALTFRLARSTDFWLHAADYPGSHVIVRNPSRGEIPHRTIIEAAELAAFYSQAKRDSKVAVHYTQKKFVSKPPRSKPGLVRLSSFKTLMVEPACRLERIP